MTTPIVDFVRRYRESGARRLHMPGHKGAALLGPEALDITEISGADVLYAPRGIIRESEENAACLFGARRTVYSCEGSSLGIRAMLFLAAQAAREQGRAPVIAAGRNAHKVFILAAALLDMDVRWLWGQDSVLRCPVTAADVEECLRSGEVTAVYLTSPDYLGNTVDIAAIAAVCHRYGALLLLDNAHGAYLRFLAPSRHPLDLGADLCCDSAHKTLPVLTGGAYLHVSESAPAWLSDRMDAAMELFASTSPSWLILQSLDMANALLAGDYPARIRDTAARLDAMKARLPWDTLGDEPLKLCIRPKGRGYTGKELAAMLEQRHVFCEFADPDFLVLMVTPETTADDFAAVEHVLNEVPARPPINDVPPRLTRPETVLRAHEALFAPCEIIPVGQCLGRVLAAPTVSCPPAVPIVVSGERIDDTALALFAYYDIERCLVTKESSGNEKPEG